ncbi:MAG: hypothetical protein AAGF74_14915, partial [Pseudomonadota bacterium]
MTGTVVFDPLLPWPTVVGLAALCAAIIAFALWRRMSGWWLRLLSLAVLIAAIANPSLQNENRTPLSDIVLIVTDESASQRIGGREAQTEAALEALTRDLDARGNTEYRVARVLDGEGDLGTRAMSVLAEMMAEVPRSRVAGAVLITDGQVHDLELAPDLPAPLHALLTGEPDDWDRRLIVSNAPGFAIIGEEVTLTLRIEDQGAVPDSQNGRVPLEISVDGGPPEQFVFATGQDITVPITLSHGGINVIQFTVPPAEGELTDR